MYLDSMSRIPYDENFFSLHMVHTLDSARAVVPLIVELIRPTSVVDLGCGLGCWLRAFQENGVSVLHGLDGDYVDTTKLLVDRSCFQAIDLRSRRFEIAGRYDLALCLEVAEHLPPGNADRLVEVLTGAAPLVLFSAAVPGQSSTGHVNEQWPSYWRSIFDKRGFQLVDAIRPRIRDSLSVSWYYRQNLLLFGTPTAISEHPALKRIAEARTQMDLEWVHVSVVAAHRTPRLILAAARAALFRRLRQRIFHER